MHPVACRYFVVQRQRTQRHRDRLLLHVRLLVEQSWHQPVVHCRGNVLRLQQAPLRVLLALR